MSDERKLLIVTREEFSRLQVLALKCGRYQLFDESAFLDGVRQILNSPSLEPGLYDLKVLYNDREMTIGVKNE